MAKVAKELALAPIKLRDHAADESKSKAGSSPEKEGGDKR